MNWRLLRPVKQAASNDYNLSAKVYPPRILFVTYIVIIKEGTMNVNSNQNRLMRILHSNSYYRGRKPRAEKPPELPEGIDEPRLYQLMVENAPPINTQPNQNPVKKDE